LRLLQIFDNVTDVAAERKLYLGGRLRRLRRELGVNQSAMAAELGLSPSYLNHLERNQRPLTAQVLLRLARSYEIDLKSFTAEGEGTGTEDLAEIFADPMFSDIAIPRYELLEVADNAPSVADAISRLYTALVERRQAPEGGSLAPEGTSLTPESWVRDHIQAQRNYFGYIEEAAETLAGALGERSGIFAALARRLREGFGVETRIVPPELLDYASQHYDYHRKRLMLSALLRAESRTFGIAYQLALFEFRPLLQRMLESAPRPTRRRADSSTCRWPITRPARS
jgi:transcriptional regulator with XRE-family HTH domain